MMLLLRLTTFITSTITNKSATIKDVQGCKTLKQSPMDISMITQNIQVLLPCDELLVLK